MSSLRWAIIASAPVARASAACLATRSASSAVRSVSMSSGRMSASELMPTIQPHHCRLVYRLNVVSLLI